MRITTLIFILMLATIAIDNVAQADERYIAEVKASDVNYIYSSTGKLTFIKTEDTAEAVDELVAKKPDGLEVTVVTYTDTGQRSPGWKLEDDE